MGEVYKAKDTRLDRTVALKVLPSHLSSDPDLRRRFEREARAISSLSHPNICTLFDVGQHEGLEYIVMEYLEGQTLADRLNSGPLPLDEVYRYAIDIADALDRAHRSGIVHRDLKPGNIVLTPTGAKLLDFGLAKWTSKEDENFLFGTGDQTTRRQPLTTAGMLLGTVKSVGALAEGRGFAPGQRVATLASLSLTPLALERVVAVRPPSAQLDVVGTAIVFASAPMARMPEDLPDDPRWHRMHGVEIRLPSQPETGQQWPSRLWIRSRHVLDGDMMHAGALAYVSDMFTGLAAAPGVAIAGPLTSIDHSVWFFRKAALDDWVLMDLQPESTAGGRGMYTGRIFSRDGNLAAAIAQETLFRPGIARA